MWWLAGRKEARMVSGEGGRFSNRRLWDSDEHGISIVRVALGDSVMLE